MNDDELALYRELQPLFREKMGMLREGDGVLLEFEPTKHDVGFVTQTKTMEAKVISADLVYVRWYSKKPWRDQSCDKRDWAEEHFLRIPDVYSRDPERPERGLWGMVDWKQISLGLLPDGSGNVTCWSTSEGQNVDGYFYPQFIYKGDTLPLALLRALKWQVENGHNLWGEKGEKE